jgi:predicted nucleic acid-binding protein
MPKPRVYVETTVPSFYHDPRTSPAVLARRRWTRLWWARAAERYDLVTSDYVRLELALGIPDLARQRVSLLEEIRILPLDTAVAETVQIYIGVRISAQRKGLRRSWTPRVRRQ